MDNVESNTVTYDYDSYVHSLKDSSTQQGMVKITPDTLTEAIFNEIATEFGFGVDWVAYQDMIAYMDYELRDTYDNTIRKSVCFIYNALKGRYSQTDVTEQQEAFESAKTDINNLNGIINKIGYKKDTNEYIIVRTCIDGISRVNTK